MSIIYFFTFEKSIDLSQLVYHCIYMIFVRKKKKMWVMLLSTWNYNKLFILYYLFILHS